MLFRIMNTLDDMKLPSSVFLFKIMFYVEFFYRYIHNLGGYRLKVTINNRNGECDMKLFSYPCFDSHKIDCFTYKMNSCSHGSPKQPSGEAANLSTQ